MRINTLYYFLVPLFQNKTYGELTLFLFFKFLDEKGKLEEETPAPSPNPFKLNCTECSAFFTPNRLKV